MIQLLSKKYQQSIAYFFLLVFFVSVTLPTRAGGGGNDGKPVYTYAGASNFPNEKERGDKRQKVNTARPFVLMPNAPKFIGGPSQPEMASFKSVSADNMVNLFTGDFSYNIPLLDVGGYPVNIYYSGNIGMEQEASWVGLGWNINPGSITRNMRGVPDDFDGTDKMEVQQGMKPNKTIGVKYSGSLEVCGITQKLPPGLSVDIGGDVGIAYNNYLGPSLDVGLNAGVNYALMGKSASEKNPGTKIKAGLSVGGDLSSRGGLTQSLQGSLTAQSFQAGRTSSFGVSLGTSYNSRVGIKELQISGQGSFDKQTSNSRFEASERILGTSISFARPTYIPTVRMPLSNSSLAGDFKATFDNGGGISIGTSYEGYIQTSQVAYPLQTKPLVGYMYYQNAPGNVDAVMDFTRLNDKEVTPNTPVISAPEYAYDVFVIQGEGTGGSIRAYRNDMGYVRDNLTVSEDASAGVGIEVGPSSHYGGNVNLVKTPSYIGDWQLGNTLREVMSFKTVADVHQSVYFKNPGETSLIGNDQFNKIGGVDLVSFQLGGPSFSPVIEPVLQHYNNDGTLMKDANTGSTVATNIVSTPAPANREKRTQVVTFLTGDEASRVGLDTTINSYDNQTYLEQVSPADNPNSNINNQTVFKLFYNKFSRNKNYRLAHHISQINVTETNGKRYVYGIPVYNTIQQDFTFSVDNTQNNYSPDYDKVVVSNNNWMSSDPGLNPLLSATSGQSSPNGYVQVTSTPAYAHSFLLTGLLSPDYVDVKGDGITEDDLGDAVKFNYTRITNTDGTGHKWRTPHTVDNQANFNSGNRTEAKDDKGIVAYGERESWYLQSIESKTMVALFFLGDRNDGKGAFGPTGGINSNDVTVKKLDHISLYNKADIYAHGLTGAKPVKTVHFVYSYRLCNHVPDNLVPDASTLYPGFQGKLTLEKIYFTFNGQERVKNGQPDLTNLNQYVFGYTNTDNQNNITGNPDYQTNAADRWGTYKPNPSSVAQGVLTNPGGLPNKDFPYSLQADQNDALNVSTINTNAGAWALKKILLPSGGQIDVDYESDDYAYVQNKHAANMVQLAGIGSDNIFSHATNNLYDYYTSTGRLNNDYVFINVPTTCNSAQDVYNLYLAGQSQFAFRIAVVMPGVTGINSPAPEEYLTVYATLDNSISIPYGVVPNSNGKTIWIKLSDENGYSPLCFTAMEYLMQQLQDQAYPGTFVPESDPLSQFTYMIESMLSTLENAFKNPFNTFQSSGFARQVEINKCFVRLNNPSGHKFGGGTRVKSVKLKDNWNVMTGQYNSVYGQSYDYTTTEVFNGVQRTISSGVASYEPGIGGEENPFQTVISVENALPLGPTSYGTIEMPMLDAFFPAASIGYSKVTVRSLADVTAVKTAKPIRSAIGKQVTNFYTAKDFPVKYALTQLDHTNDVQQHEDPTKDFFFQSSFDSRAISQGFLVTTNDMHGKLKSQASYAANDENTMVNYTENFYTNTGSNGMNDVFSFVNYKANGAIPPGSISKGNIGVDAELMVDAREFYVESNSTDVQAQVEFFSIVPPIPVPFPLPTVGESQNIYRAVTTTKLVNYHSMVDSVVVIDKGSRVTTKNILYDAETGDVIVNQTNNEFNKPIYTTTYPAYWAYSGMGPASQNIDAVYTGVSFSNGDINSSQQTPISTTDPSYVKLPIFESGDELLIIHATPPTLCDGTIHSNPPSFWPQLSGVDVIWALNTNKSTDNTGLTDAAPVYKFIDAKGKPYTNANVTFRIIRSGKRNMLDAHLQSITTMANPIINNGTQLNIDNTTQAVNATAMEYKEKWQTDADEISGFVTIITNCTPADVASCNISDDTYHLDKNINPYTRGLLGNFSPYRSVVFYNSRAETSSTTQTNLPKNGLLSSFTPYWNFNVAGSLMPLHTSDEGGSQYWVWNSLTTRKNAKGQELENKNALGIYTAAQYGYNKTLPVAITNNAAYSEGAYDGFEDYSYTNSLNNASLYVQPCQKHIDFSTMLPGNSASPAASVQSVDQLNFAAHSGKYVLKLPAATSAGTSSIATKTFAVADNNPVTEFPFVFGNSTPQMLNSPGGNVAPYPTTIAYPGWEGNDPLVFPDYSIMFKNDNSNNPASNGGFLSGIGADAGYGIKVNNKLETNQKYSHSFSISLNYYFYVYQAGAYHFNFWATDKSTWFDGQADSYNGYVTLRNNDAQGKIVQTANIVADESSINSAKANLNSVQLCPGIYYMSVTLGNGISAPPKSSSEETSTSTYGIRLSTDLNTNGSFDYKYSTTTCSSATPIVGDPKMLNPIFTVPSSKPMMLSAWVREDAPTSGTAPYPPVAYKNNQLQLSFTNSVNTAVPIGGQFQFDANGQPAKDGNGNQLQPAQTISFLPTGPVIDGWQQYQCYFQAPPNATNMALSFVNNSAGNVYFDDIRLHPFNANMKSYVYDPVTQRLVAQLDANNYATFYEYDEEGTLIRTKAETKEGIKTIKETRSAKQKMITTIQ
jgi:hypothetical protein